ncbi:Replication protein E1, partial [Clarias magur]
MDQMDRRRRLSDCTEERNRWRGRQDGLRGIEGKIERKTGEINARARHGGVP